MRASKERPATGDPRGGPSRIVSFGTERREDTSKGVLAQTRPLLVPAKADASHLTGADPRTLTAEDFAAATAPILRPAAAIRARCLDCSGGSVAEVRKCVATNCALWPHRMGVFPLMLRAGVQGQGKSAKRFLAERFDDSARDGPSEPPGSHGRD